MRYLVAALFLTSCASVQRSLVSVELPPKPPGCAVELLGVAPQRSFQEIAMLKLLGDYTDHARYAPKVREEVCALGGDAAILTPLHYGANGAEASATVIRWK